MSMSGYYFVNFVTAALHKGETAEFIVGFALVVVVIALANLDAAAIGGASRSFPRKAITGQVIIFWIEQSLTKCRTVNSNADCERLSPVSHPSHAVKICRVS